MLKLKMVFFSYDMMTDNCEIVVTDHSVATKVAVEKIQSHISSLVFFLDFLPTYG